MKSVIIGMTLSVAAMNIAARAVGSTFEIAASYEVHVDGQNKDGTFIPQVAASETDIDFTDAVAFGQVSGAIDDGFGTARASATGTHKPGSNPNPNLRKLATLEIGGTANASRQDFDPQFGGNIGVVASATVEYNDLLTIQFFPSNTPMHIQGFYRLTGQMNVAATKNGSNPDIQADAFARVDLSGTGMPLVSKFSHMNTSGINDVKLPDAVNEFSYDVFSDVEKAIQLKLQVSGSASAGGSHLSTFKGGSAAAGFTADFSHTLEWGGITKVTNLLTGEDVTNWTVTSASGYDYSQLFEVPEPNSWVLLLSGFLGIRRRRLKSRPT
jgi:hypothetical protein